MLLKNTSQRIQKHQRILEIHLAEFQELQYIQYPRKTRIIVLDIIILGVYRGHVDSRDHQVYLEDPVKRENKEEMG